MEQKKDRNEQPAIDLTKFPLIAMTLEQVRESDLKGHYDEETEMWSHRDWFAFSPKKSNEEN